MRRLGWYADSMPELVMNLGTWAMIFGLGILGGNVYSISHGTYIFLAGGLVGVAGQIAWAVRNGELEVSER